jgi:hypothetical protein
MIGFRSEYFPVSLFRIYTPRALHSTARSEQPLSCRTKLFNVRTQGEADISAVRLSIHAALETASGWVGNLDLFERIK